MDDERIKEYTTEIKSLYGAIADQELTQHIALYYRNLYKSLLSEGFSRTDAMQILCSLKLN